MRFKDNVEGLCAAAFAFLLGNGAGPLSIDHWVAQRRLRRVASDHRGRFERGEPIEITKQRRRGAA